MTRYDPKKVTPDTVAKLVFSAELKTTGRKPDPVALQMMLSVREFDQGRDRIHKRRTGIRTKGQDAAESLHRDLEALAYQREGRAKSWLLSTGMRGQSSKKR